MLAIHSVQTYLCKTFNLQFNSRKGQPPISNHYLCDFGCSLMRGSTLLYVLNVSEEGLTHNLINKGLNGSAKYNAAKAWA